MITTYMNCRDGFFKMICTQCKAKTTLNWGNSEIILCERCSNNPEAFNLLSNRVKKNINPFANIISKVLAISLGILILIPIVFYAGLFLIFAGSLHSPPPWYEAYLILVFALPLLVGSLSWIVLIFKLVSDEAFGIWAKLLGLSAAIFGAGLIILMIILD